jgi:hypothetical protein
MTHPDFKSKPVSDEKYPKFNGTASYTANTHFPERREHMYIRAIKVTVVILLAFLTIGVGLYIRAFYRLGRAEAYAREQSLLRQVNVSRTCRMVAYKSAFSMRFPESLEYAEIEYKACTRGDGFMAITNL